MILNYILICICITLFLLILAIKLPKNKPMGYIEVGKTEDGTNTWRFVFFDDVTYEAISNMKKVTFEIRKSKSKINEIEIKEIK